MSLTRYFNKDIILDKNYPSYAKIYDPQFLSVLDIKVYLPWIKTLETQNLSIETEIHLYTFTGDIVGSSYNSNLEIHKDTRECIFDVKNVFNSNGLATGSYKAVFNITLPVLGTIENKLIQISEISPNRKELKLQFDSNEHKNLLIDYFSEMKSTGNLNNNCLNFGENEIYNIINYRADNDFVYVKLYQELSEVFEERSRAFVIYEIADPYIDSLTVTHNILPQQNNKLRGPRFNMDADRIDSNSTIYKCWEELLSTDQMTSQNIIDKIINSDDSVTLNIDYTFFDNFIFYSRAKTRIENFYSKVEMIDQFNEEIVNLETNSDNYAVNDIKTKNEYISKIRNSFDSFERWLYYHDNTHIFTHDIRGPLKPWPKEFVNGILTLKATNSTDVTTWYKNILEIAEDYDRKNTKSLWWSIPEHILMDEGNSEYILFVEMIGQHYDNIWLYIKALTQIHEKDEHLERGAPNELLYDIAKSFGWNLQNTRVLSDLWLYKEGVDEDGTNLDITTHESQTQQVWKRIVNNLPYLLKTKGTGRSVNALMSIYGIPKTLISIKEYGGPGLDGDKPLLIEDRYHYKLELDATRRVETILDTKLCDVDGWNPDIICKDPVEDILINGKFTYGLQNWKVVGDLPEIVTLFPPGNPLAEQFGNSIQVSDGDSTTLSQTLNLIPGNYYNLSTVLTLNPGCTINFKHNGTTEQTFNSSGNPTLNYFFQASTEDTIEYELISASGVGVTMFLVELEREDEYNRFPDTYEFRFQIDGDYNIDDKIYLGGFDRDGDDKIVLSITKIDELYGKLTLTSVDSDVLQIEYESNELPLFNNDYWTIRLFKTQPLIGTYTDTGTLTINISSAADCLFGKPVHNDTIVTNNQFLLGQTFNSNTTDEVKFHIGGSPVSYALETLVAFNGYIQGYKEYFGGYSLETFYEHVLNPAAYSVDDFDNTMYSLWKYYPLGLDLQRWTHANGSTHPSSHPDRNETPSEMTFYGFNDIDQVVNYPNDNETYYINIPKIGGRTIQSEKIRIEDVVLERKLSPDNTATTSEFDTHGFDSDRLAIVFSLADQINRDIYNHMGVSNLDGLIGDPQYEFDEEYVKFNNVRSEYFRKYTQKNDINAFIRLFSVYDYTFFEQLKQLVPARANLIVGILIEPHILERNKVVISKLPSVESPVFEDIIDLNIWDEFSENVLHEADLNVDTLVKMEALILKGLITDPYKINIFYSILRGAIQIDFKTGIDFNQFKATTSIEYNLTGSEVWLSSAYKGSLKASNPYKGFTGDLQPIYDQVPTTCKYQLKTPIYTWYTGRKEYLDLTYDPINWPTFDNLDAPNNDYEGWNPLAFDPRLTKSFVMEVDYYVQKNIEIPAGSYEMIIYAMNDISDFGENLEIELDNGPETIEIIAETKTADLDTSFIRPLHYTFELTQDLPLTVNITSKSSGEINLFSVEIFKQYTNYEKDYFKLQNTESRNEAYNILTDTGYQHVENGTENRKRYIGSKLTGPDFNRPSDQTIDKGPVVEYREVNANILRTTDENGRSNLTVE